MKKQYDEIWIQHDHNKQVLADLRREKDNVELLFKQSQINNEQILSDVKEKLAKSEG